MFIPRSFILALLSAPFLAYAQNSNANPFSVGKNGLQATAGQPLVLNWKPTTQGTVSLILRSGSSNNLASGQPIVSNIANSGTYTWNVPDSITRGSDYTIEIVDDADPSQNNYSPYFVLESTNTVASSTGQESLGAPSSSLSLSTAAPTASPSSATAATTTGSSSGSASSSPSTTGSSSPSSTGSMTTSTSSGRSSASSSQAPTTGNDLVASQTTSTTASGNGGARATAMAGMLGVVALGALAL